MDEQNKPEEQPAEPAAEQQIPKEPEQAAASERPADRRSALPEPQIVPEEVPKQLEQEPQDIARPTQVYVPRAGGAAAADVKPSKVQKLKDFATECKRVLRVTKKPDRMEFKTIVKIAGIGMAVIGFLGFLVHFVKELAF